MNYLNNMTAAQRRYHQLMDVSGIINSMKPLMSRKEVGDHFGISQQAVDQIERMAIWKIKQKMLEVCKEEA